MYASPILPKEYRTKYKNIYLNLSQKYDLIFMPFILEGIIFKNKYLLPDKSHPNFEGVKIMAKNLITYLALIL
jgi:acyl-CoA thioesterase-1